jgi:hypothetical protein
MRALDLPIEAMEPKMRGQIRQPTLLLMHILAGRSILTVQSHKTSNRFTFRFSRPDEEPDRKRPIWVSMYGGTGGYLAQEADRRAWTFLGTIWPPHPNDAAQRFNYTHSPKSPIWDSTTIEHRTVRWITYHLSSHVDQLMEDADWWHEGVCGRCGRRLTVPTSIETGFGPDCAGRMGR